MLRTAHQRTSVGLEAWRLDRIRDHQTTRSARHGLGSSFHLLRSHTKRATRSLTCRDTDKTRLCQITPASNSSPRTDHTPAETPWIRSLSLGNYEQPGTVRPSSMNDARCEFKVSSASGSGDTGPTPFLSVVTSTTPKRYLPASALPMGQTWRFVMEVRVDSLHT